MERTVQLFVTIGTSDTRVDLFKDEQISVTSSIQNISDISKTFTDFSQSFTLPASTVNNNLFEHYYQSDVDNGFEANVRVTARIEIDYTPFRIGKLQLEGTEVKDGQIDSYKCTFYGEVTTLKDTFGEKKLRDLDYSALTATYTGASVETAIQTTSDVDVRYPLISSSRLWNNSAADANDITTNNSYPLAYTELFPAIKNSVIFDAIEAEFGVTFNGIFLSDKRFTNLFTWWKNQEAATFNTVRKECLFDSGSKPLLTNVAYQEYKDPTDFSPTYSNPIHQINLYLVPDDPAVYYKVWVYNYGTLVTCLDGGGAGNGYLGSQMFTINSATIANNYLANGSANEWSFRVSTSDAVTITGTVIYRWVDNAGTTLDSDIAGLTPMVFTAGIDWNSSAPDIKVADYFAGILKMFNLTCYPTDSLTFQIEPLEDWYSKGRDVNITEYVDIKSINYDRVKLHKKLQFDYGKSKSFINEAFLELTTEDWGSLRNSFNYDGSEFNVKLPFENIQFSNLDAAKFQVGYCLTKAPDYKPYVPMPVMLYLQESQTCDFYFDNGSTVPQLTDYMAMGQDVNYNGTDYSLNFNSDISSLLLEPVEQSLYKTYYEGYLLNLFNTKNRKVTLKAILPVRLLTDIDMNDNLIIRDKKYRIDSFKSNLTTGLVDLVLLNDFTKDKRIIPPHIPPLIPAGDTGPIVIPIRPPKGHKITVAVGTATFTTPTPSLPNDYTVDGTVSFAFSANTNPSKRSDTYTLKYYDETDTLYHTTTVTLSQDGDWDWLITEDGKRILTEDLREIVGE